MICGIDYGSKKAGTTAIAILEGKEVTIEQSLKGKDADQFILAKLNHYNFKGTVFLDAPLSLPKVYTDPAVTNPNFHYRQCDKETRAMSPMFLGGLTARAIELNYQLSKLDIACVEAYPARIAEHLELAGYKKEQERLPDLTTLLAHQFGITLKHIPTNWHQFDSLLALIIGIRYSKGQSISIGDPDEGLIHY
jgi:predicted nuclease with RNAse H fold